MTLEILICTIDEGLENIPRMVMPPKFGISYLVSCQYTTPEPPEIPSSLELRSDVNILFPKGKGLCRNRNYAFDNAKGDILMIADDDEVLNEKGILNVLKYYEEHPDVDLLHCKIQGTPKQYPPEFVSSLEITIRRSSLNRVYLRFDERFGLGSDYLASGEEDVFIYDARKKGLKVLFYPEVICTIDGVTTGDLFLQDKRVQRSKGAVFAYTRGKYYAFYKCLRESLGWMFRAHVNPIPLFCNMCKGIFYV